jgi:hypothetical protein
VNNDPEKHRGRPWPSQIEENSVIAGGLIREYPRVKALETRYKKNISAILHIHCKGILQWTNF